MSVFTTRVELNGSPSWQEYERLHEAMKWAGFTRLIRGSDGKQYHLPTAEYNSQADLTAAQVRDAARTAALSVWSDVQVLSTEGSRAWVGLREATPAEVSAA